MSYRDEINHGRASHSNIKGYRGSPLKIIGSLRRRTKKSEDEIFDNELLLMLSLLIENIFGLEFRLNCRGREIERIGSTN